jgi:hypothetical protein
MCALLERKEKTKRVINLGKIVGTVKKQKDT